MVLMLQEPSFMAAGDTGQRQTHPRTPSYCPGGQGPADGIRPVPSSQGKGSARGLGASWDTQHGGILQPHSFTAWGNLPKGLFSLPQSEARGQSQLAAISSG